MECVCAVFIEEVAVVVEGGGGDGGEGQRDGVEKQGGHGAAVARDILGEEVREGEDAAGAHGGEGHGGAGRWPRRGAARAGRRRER